MKVIAVSFFVSLIVSLFTALGLISRETVAPTSQPRTSNEVYITAIQQDLISLNNSMSSVSPEDLSKSTLDDDYRATADRLSVSLGNYPPELRPLVMALSYAYMDCARFIGLTKSEPSEATAIVGFTGAVDCRNSIERTTLTLLQSASISGVDVTFNPK